MSEENRSKLVEKVNEAKKKVMQVMATSTKLTLFLQEGEIKERLTRKGVARVYSCEVCQRRQRASAFLLAPGEEITNETSERTTKRDVVSLRDVKMKTVSGYDGHVCTRCMCFEHLYATDGVTIIPYPIIIKNEIYGINKWAPPALGDAVAKHVLANPTPDRSSVDLSAVEFPEGFPHFVRFAILLHHTPRPFNDKQIYHWTAWVACALNCSSLNVRLSNISTFRVFSSSKEDTSLSSEHRCAQIALTGSKSWTTRTGSSSRRRAAKHKKQ